MNSTDIIRDYIDNQIGYSRTEKKSSINMDEITLPSGEKVIVSYADTSITGTDRAKPQIRVFADKAVEAFKTARAEKKRFFCLTIYSKASTYVTYMSNISLEDYIVSIETDMTDMSGRMDIRSLYEWLDTYTASNGTQDYIRCDKDNHTCGIFQASFIRIKNGATFLTDYFKNYFNIFDLRPYFIISKKTFNYSPISDTNKRNLISFGAPGTGKSYGFKTKLDKLKCPASHYERVTFFADYSYSQFVGTYKPIDVGGTITYKFVPGPFMRILVNALRSGMSNSPEKFYLIIEEINRAKAAAVFGDMFQLLDRDSSGKSEYSINASEDVRNYLADVFGGSATEYSELKIPNNMFIWATMNSADQGVFPMDTAFKRRWNFNYIGIDDDEITEDSTGTKVENIKLRFTLNGDVIRWNVLRRAINAKLSSDTDDIRAHEDKLMGPFFVKCDQYTLDTSDVISTATENDEFLSVFCEKVLMYLFEDVARTRRDELFDGIKGKCSRYSDVRAAFMKDGLEIFGKDFKTKYYDTEEKEYDAKKVREGV